MRRQQSATEPITIYTAQGESEAQVIRSFLYGHGITCCLRGEALRLTHGFSLDGLGEVEIQVPPTLENEARELLAAVERGEFAIEEGDVSGAAG